MRETKLLIVLTISAGALSCILYRAVVNAPQPHEARPVKKAGSLQGPAPLGIATPTSPSTEPDRVGGTQGETSVNVAPKTDPFADSKELSPEETKRVFEESMKGHTTAGKDTEKAFMDSMQKGRSEKISDREQEDAFQRSMGSGVSEQENQARFKESMGIK
jgi:hypothetical protein